jgi:hypothetical protein
MRAYLIALAAVLLGAGSAAAECVTVQQVIDANPTATVAAHLDSANSAPFLAAAKKTTGVDLPEEEVLILTKEGFPTYVILFKGGCATKRGSFRPAMVDEWLHGLAG